LVQSSPSKSDGVAINNLSVCSLFSGRMLECHKYLSAFLQSYPSSFLTAEPLIFNLATCYELGPDVGGDRKRELVKRAAQLGGECLKAGAFKLEVK